MTAQDSEPRSGIGKLIALGLFIYLIAISIIGWYWSREPALVELDHIYQQPSINNSNNPQVAQGKIIGAATTSTLIFVGNTLLDKPGGFTSNDILPPGVLMDNMPNWEYGALIQVRDLSKAMREAFSRSQSQSKEDTDLAIAESRFHFDHKSWAIPASESQYREGIEHMEAYLERLRDEDQHNAQFYARADNLRYWLSTVETRLGSLSQRLSASVGQRRLNTDLAGELNAKQSTASPQDQIVKTPRLEIDDVFYQARGSTWALIHFLKAVEVDFADVLENKKALVSLQQIIRELEATQQPVMSPIILNGDGFGMVSNHSLVMASYIARANAQIIDLRELLSQG